MLLQNHSFMSGYGEDGGGVTSVSSCVSAFVSVKQVDISRRKDETQMFLLCARLRLWRQENVCFLDRD